MTDRIVSSNDPSRAKRVKVITFIQCRRHLTTQEKVRFVEGTICPAKLSCSSPAVTS